MECVFINFVKGKNICIPEEQRDVNGNYNESIEFFIKTFLNGGIIQEEFRYFTYQDDNGLETNELWNGKHRYMVAMISLCISKILLKQNNEDTFLLERCIYGCCDFTIKSNKIDSDTFTKIMYEGQFSNEDKKTNVYKMYRKIYSLLSEMKIEEIQQLVQNLIDNQKSKLRIKVIKYSDRQNILDWYNSQNMGAAVTPYDRIKATLINKDSSFIQFFNKIDCISQMTKAKFFKNYILMRVMYAICQEFHDVTLREDLFKEILLKSGGEFCCEYLEFEEKIYKSNDVYIRLLCLKPFYANNYLVSYIWDLHKHHVNLHTDIYHKCILIMLFYHIRCKLFKDTGHLESRMAGLVSKALDNGDYSRVVTNIYNQLNKFYPYVFQENNIIFPLLDFTNEKDNNIKRIYSNLERYLEEKEGNTHWTVLNWDLYDKDHSIPKKYCDKNNFDKHITNCPGNISLVEKKANRSIKDKSGELKEKIFENTSLLINSNEFRPQETEESITENNKKKIQEIFKSTDPTTILL